MAKVYSGWHIPDDWEGEWQCYRVQWPKSEKWENLLIGLIFTLTRGREWDAETGVLAEAQEAGWQVFDANMPPILCDGTIAPPSAPQGGTGTGGGIVIEGEEMGQVVTAVELNENGTLRVYYGHCCWEDLDLAAALQVSTKVPGDIWSEYDPEQELNACGKADAVVEYLYDLMQDFWDARDVEPWKWFGRIMGSRPELAGGGDLIYPTMFNLFAVDLIYEYSDIFDDYKKQSMKCILAKQVTAEADGMGGKGVTLINAAAGQLYDATIANFFFGCAGVVGNGDWDEIATGGAANAEADCRCPDEISPAEDYEWSQVFDLTSQDYYDTYTRGSWVDGSGTESESFSTAEYIQANLGVKYTGASTPDGTTIRYVRVTIAGSWGGTPLSSILLRAQAATDTLLTLSDIDGNEAVYEGSLAINPSVVNLTHNVGIDGNHNKKYITKIEIGGDGINPFE